jgi:CubicO group peptidase (beta-lactamase class C family)
MRRIASLVLVGLVSLAACSDGNSSDDTTVRPTAAAATDSTATDEPSTTEAPLTTVPSGGGELGLPAQPDDVAFPTDEWPTGDLPAGVERAALDELARTAFDVPGGDAHVRSVVVIHQGRLVYEAYHPSYDADSVNASFSVAKSVASAAIGILAGDGAVDVDAPAPVAGWDDDRRTITVEHLLHMASGLEWAEVYVPGSAPFEMFAAADASDSVAARPLVSEPASVFNYSTGTSAILAQIVTDAAWAAERDAEIDPEAEPDAEAGVRFLEERLFGPLGITSVELQRDPEGTWLGGLGANMTSRDFARFGLLYMRNGVWDGERILPEGWVDYTFTPSPASAGYGAHWWLESDRYEARGLFGQYVSLVPADDLIVVVNSQQGGGASGLLGGVIDAFGSR